MADSPWVTTSREIAALPGISELFGAPVLLHRGLDRETGVRGVLAWGRKPSAGRAERLARRRGFALYRVEDGFLRSVGLGRDDSPLSLVVDDLGIYYDASSPSRLEELICRSLSDSEAARARELMAAWRFARVSKYNHLRETDGLVPAGRYVLVADQTFGDASIRYGLAEATGFHRMLDAALAENPDCTVVLKVHPDVMSGRKKGHFDLTDLVKHPRVRVLGEDVHPVSLIQRAEAVYAVTSQMGFEGLLWGKRVRTFGMPFYAGWGLTEDELPAPERRRPVALENLVHAALVEYPFYIDPETGIRCEPERVIEWMGFQRVMRQRFSPVIYAKGFSIYKRMIVRRFFQGSSVRFVRKTSQVPDGAAIALWGTKREGQGKEREFGVIRLEDGFLRSVGLGADLVAPLSWVMDRRGIYYDATRPSDLECLLQENTFDAELVQRAGLLRQRIVGEGLTKYNVGAGSWERPAEGEATGGDLRVILVPGQVESDASIRYGASSIRTNMDLLRAVREANPDAYVVYKPHPDVQTGLRSGGKDEGDARRWCDEVVHDVPMQTLLEAVDEVHILTSLAGFEALLRGKPVVTYGQPFYAGWGLTRDMGLLPEVAQRRTRRLSLDELVAGVLIAYPAYVSRTTGRFTTPERALDELLAWRQQGTKCIPLWRRALSVVLRWAARMGF